LLLREITHRVCNEFASAIQVVSLTAAKSPDGNVKAALAGVMEQLHNYARVLPPPLFSVGMSFIR
jgi:two-component sensor histidine kinase